MNVIVRVCGSEVRSERYSDGKTKACVNLKIRERGIGVVINLILWGVDTNCAQHKKTKMPTKVTAF
jgi:hypothetical protein